MRIIKPSCVRDIKKHVKLAGVVVRSVALQKASRRQLKGFCPFHKGGLASFHVDPHRGFYKCFECGRAGDVITFVRDMEVLTFSSAVETLGERFGIPIKYEEGSGDLSAE